MRFAFRAFVATSGREIRRGPRRWTTGISREDLPRSRVPVNVVGRLDHQPRGPFVGKICRIEQKRLHLLIGFDDYPKATGTTHKSRRVRIPSRITAQVSENQRTDRQRVCSVHLTSGKPNLSAFPKTSFDLASDSACERRKNLDAGRNIAEARTIVWLSLNMSQWPMVEWNGNGLRVDRPRHVWNRLDQLHLGSSSPAQPEGEQ